MAPWAKTHHCCLTATPVCVWVCLFSDGGVQAWQHSVWVMLPGVRSWFFESQRIAVLIHSLHFQCSENSNLLCQIWNFIKMYLSFYSIIYEQLITRSLTESTDKAACVWCPCVYYLCDRLYTLFWFLVVSFRGLPHLKLHFRVFVLFYFTAICLIWLV